MDNYTNLSVLLEIQSLSRSFRYIGNHMLDEVKCPIEYTQLCFLYSLSKQEHTRESSIRDMCRELNTEASTFFRASMKLEKLGLISRKLVSYSDKKRTIYLTEAGKKMIDTYEPVLYSVAEAVMGEAYKDFMAAIKKVKAKQGD